MPNNADQQRQENWKACVYFTYSEQTIAKSTLYKKLKWYSNSPNTSHVVLFLAKSSMPIVTLHTISLLVLVSTKFLYFATE